MAAARHPDVGQSGDLRVRDNPDEHRYEATIDGDVVGYIDYHSQPRLMTLLHTEVEPAFEGRGFGSRLVAGALKDIRSRDMSVLPICSFVRGYIASHPEYADLVGVK